MLLNGEQNKDKNKMDEKHSTEKKKKKLSKRRLKYEMLWTASTHTHRGMA